MVNWIASYFVFELLVIAVAVLGTLWYRRRRLRSGQNQPPAGFVRTDEVFIDPTTGIRQRVWYNPETGERYYETES